MLKKLLLIALVLSVLVNVFQYHYFHKQKDEMLESTQASTAGAIIHSLINLNTHIDLLEKESWSNEEHNQEVFERMDDIILTIQTVSSVNQHVYEFPISDRIKLWELRDMMVDRYRGNEVFYQENGIVQKEIHEGVKVSIRNLSKNIDSFIRANSHESEFIRTDWKTFIDSLDYLFQYP